MRTLKAKHPRAVMWMHWLNFPLLSLMIWSGLMIYWADPAFGVIPGWLFERLGLDGLLARGMAVHFTIAWLFSINGLAYALYCAFSGEWRELVPERASWREAFLVMLHDLRLRKDLPAQGRYNAAQRVSYTMIVLAGAGSVLTGLAIYKPVQLGWLARLLGGYRYARFEHFALTLGYCGFFVVHVAQVIRAGWGNFASMVSGYEVVE